MVSAVTVSVSYAHAMIDPRVQGSFRDRSYAGLPFVLTASHKMQTAAPYRYSHYVTVIENKRAAETSWRNLLAYVITAEPDESVSYYN